MNPYAPPAVLAPVLRPAAWLYGLATAWRNRQYEAGTRPTEQLAHPVLAVGNLTVGGTGKTPVVAHLAAELQRRGWRPAILSRGYRRRGERGEAVAVVSDGTIIRLGPEDAGDEPVLLARRLPGVPVLCHRRRGIAGRWAEANLSVNLFILDDGFQHLALDRDCNLLLLDGAEPLGNGRLLPAGPLREHPRGMRRADLILFTRCAAPAVALPPDVARHACSVPVFSSDFVPAGLVDGDARAAGALDALRGRRAVAFCGLARPETFFGILESAGIALIARLAFADHQIYDAAARERIAAACRRDTPDVLLTTEKDLVKLPPEAWPCPLRAVSIAVHVHQPSWLDAIEARLTARQSGK
ncbi:MAG: tetraacyldisaccharide 4'-kinase [Acidobacteria bacterium]|nr:tetraacyldisaccharide 4'-kinase [Acidobacteriota bacterium]